jgi:hypothetical protein
MNADAMGGDPATRAGEPTEDELRAAYEAELSRVTSTDMIAQAAVSLLNLGARRLTGDPAGGAAPGGPTAGTASQSGRDLDQARDSIDAARALLGILERTIPQELGPLRDALSQLQMAYAREAQAAPGETQAPPQSAPAQQGAAAQPGEDAAAEERPSGPGPAQASGRLWVPGS